MKIEDMTLRQGQEDELENKFSFEKAEMDAAFNRFIAEKNRLLRLMEIAEGLLKLSNEVLERRKENVGEE